MDLADELGLSTVTVVAMCHSLGIDAHAAGSELSAEDVAQLRATPPPSPIEAPTPTRFMPATVDPRAASADPWAAAGFAPPAEPVVVRSARRRRDPLVSGAWSQWWRAMAILAILTLVYTYTLYRIDRVSTFTSDTGLHLPTTAPSRVVTIVLFAAPLAFISLRVFQAAQNAHAAWDRIGDSPDTLGGRPSIVFLWAAAAAFTLTFAALVLVGTAWTVLGLFA